MPLVSEKYVFDLSVREYICEYVENVPCGEDSSSTSTETWRSRQNWRNVPALRNKLRPLVLDRDVLDAEIFMGAQQGPEVTSSLRLQSSRPDPPATARQFARLAATARPTHPRGSAARPVRWGPPAPPARPAPQSPPPDPFVWFVRLFTFCLPPSPPANIFRPSSSSLLAPSILPPPFPHPFPPRSPFLLSSF